MKEANHVETLVTDHPDFIDDRDGLIIAISRLVARTEIRRAGYTLEWGCAVHCAHKVGCNSRTISLYTTYRPLEVEDAAYFTPNGEHVRPTGQLPKTH